MPLLCPTTGPELVPAVVFTMFILTKLSGSCPVPEVKAVPHSWLGVRWCIWVRNKSWLEHHPLPTYLLVKRVRNGL